MNVNSFILSQKKIALDCGFEPSESVLVAFIPKLDTVVQELYQGDHTLHVLDGVVLDMTGLKRVRWWQVLDACRAAHMPIVETTGAGKASSFTTANVRNSGEPRYDGARLHMRAYSHGPWICIEPEQLASVYNEHEEKVYAE